MSSYVTFSSMAPALTYEKKLTGGRNCGHLPECYRRGGEPDYIGKNGCPYKSTRWQSYVIQAGYGASLRSAYAGSMYATARQCHG